MQPFLEKCREIVGENDLITKHELMLPFLTEWRKRFTGSALAVISPATTEEVSAIIRLCRQYSVPVVPQGGNTGLVIGSVPDASGKAIVLSLKKMNRIREIDAANNTMTVEAGCILDHVQKAAEESDRLYPLAMASSGLCTVGGNLAVNSGGTAVLQYGTARDLCLGLEVVNPDGTIWNGLKSLRKDTTGYDLKDIYIGSEGTLGVITAAVLKLYPLPKIKLTAFVALDSAQHALELLNMAQQFCGSGLTAFELLSGYCLELVLKHFPDLSSPLPATYSQYALIELSDSESETHATQLLEQLLEQAMENEIVRDASIAQSIAQSRTMWQLRENISEAQAKEGNNIKHDIALPVSFVPEFLLHTDKLLQEHFPGCRNVTFGHLGDGSLHYNVSSPTSMSADAFLALQPEINRIVYDSVARFGGTMAAEHGLGTLKRDELARYKSGLEIELMQKIKKALDPDNLMNSGKVL